MSGLRHNLAANFTGQAWRAAMSLVFVPLYIKYLGIESYGLIGAFAVLQSSLVLLDLGVRNALTREMSRCSDGVSDVQSLWDLLRSSEMLALAVALLVTSATWWWSDLLATDWVQAETLPEPIVAHAFSMMGFVASLQFLENLYTGCLLGLQRQVAQNAIMCSVATLRGAGAVAILAWASPTLEAFFTWQAACSVIGLCSTAIAVYRALPIPLRSPRFSPERLRSIWRFSGGTFAISALALALTKADKILLSRLIPLDQFGYYIMAGSIAGALLFVVAPITTAYFPRFNRFLVVDDYASLQSAYHESAQLVSVTVGSVGAALVILAKPLLFAWTGDPVLSTKVAPVLSVLALGTMLNGIMWIPYQMQLAHGWTSLAIGINSIAVFTLIPAMVWVVPLYGSIGAAWVWVILNVGYVIFGVHFMHSRILPNDKWRWYIADVATPVSAAFAVAWFISQVVPSGLGRFALACVVAATIAMSIGAGILAAGGLRSKVSRYIRGV